MLLVASFFVMNTEAIEIPNPHKSENMWAASVIIDKELAK
jgi:hypothetical protein